MTKTPLKSAALAAALALLQALPALAQTTQIRVGSVNAEIRPEGTHLSFTVMNRDTLPLDGFVAEFTCRGASAKPPHDHHRITVYYQLAPYGERPREFQRKPGSYHWISAQPDGRVPAQGSNHYGDVLTGLHFHDWRPFLTSAVSCYIESIFPQYGDSAPGQGRWAQPWGGAVGPAEPWQWPNPHHPTFSPSYVAPEQRDRFQQQPPWAAPQSDTTWF